ncbi:hypothetical protein [Phocaeicola plebeius]|uniref:hypothetical protein n=1 Tax=Phocaeicola plebeius TaxID=310297 RepID=UPI0026EFA6B2|nr:hypothetical protein [Phocaeicola plebeius]
MRCTWIRTEASEQGKTSERKQLQIGTGGRTMRLIDADALKKDLKSVTLSNGTLVNTNAVLYLLEEYPTAYDVDKVVEQLENERKFWENAYNRNLGKEKARSYEHAIEIVKGGGVDG